MYDELDRPKKVTCLDGKTVMGTARGCSKTVGSVATRYLYDGIEIAVELDAAGAVKAGYLHGPKIDELLCSRSSVTNTSLYHLTDHLGSTAMLTDSVRAAQAGFLYSAFGDLRQKTGTADTNWRFTGRQFDPESGLYHYRARGYDARAGRFLQRDPSGMVDGPNLYVYVGNNPWSFIDPLGLEKKDLGPFEGLREFIEFYVHIEHPLHTGLILVSIETAGGIAVVSGAALVAGGATLTTNFLTAPVGLTVMAGGAAVTGTGVYLIAKGPEWVSKVYGKKSGDGHK